MFGYQYQENYSHSIFGFFMMGTIVFFFFFIALVMTIVTQGAAFGASGTLLGVG